MKHCFYILFLCLSVIACSKTESQPKTTSILQFPDRRTTTLYLIKSGNHYCEQNLPQIMNRSSMSARITFDSSAKYTLVAADNQADVNKLMGFSDCGNDHQQNSARIGWSWSGQNLVLYAYSYVNKVRIIKTLGNFSLYKPINCSIKAENNYYYFKADNMSDSIPRYCSGYDSSRYKLFPYFGGDETAPHDVKILIEEN